MRTTAPQPPGPRRATNERVELGRYTISAGGRILYGQRVLGVVRLVDVPAEVHGRRYIIERGPTCMAESKAIVADYLEQSARFAPAGSDIGVEMSVGPSLANSAASGRIGGEAAAA